MTCCDPASMACDYFPWNCQLLAITRPEAAGTVIIREMLCFWHPNRQAHCWQQPHTSYRAASINKNLLCYFLNCPTGGSLQGSFRSKLLNTKHPSDHLVDTRSRQTKQPRPPSTMSEVEGQPWQSKIVSASTPRSWHHLHQFAM